MKVVSYIKVVPNTNKIEKINILTKFIQGVNRCGDVGKINDSYTLEDSDVAIIQGWQHTQGKTGLHLQLRQNIIDTQINSKKFVITGDSNLFLYANPTNEPHHYLRYSINGVFPNTGIYCDTDIDPTRWKQISADTGIVLQEPKRNGNHILICLQRNGGWSMGNIDVVNWIKSVYDEIRKYSDRPIVVRPHPGDKNARIYLNKNIFINKLENLRISFNTPLEHDLINAWAVVNHNSSSIVGPIIRGYNAFITDPIRSQCAEVSHTGFSDLENPKEFDRQHWLERISMFHWKFSELESGVCWSHMKNYLRQ